MLHDAVLHHADALFPRTKTRVMGKTMSKEMGSESETNIDSNVLKRILEEEVGYSKMSARTTAQSLLEFQSCEHDDLDTALHRWIADRTDMALVSEGVFNTFDLVEIGLTYPAALVFIDWARSDPAFAARSLEDRTHGLSPEQ